MRLTLVTVCFFGVVLADSAFTGNTALSLLLEEYDCTCSYFCPTWGMQAGPCLDNDHRLWGWTTSTYCCVPSYLDYDHPLD